MFFVRLNNLLNKQTWFQWIGMPWRSYDVPVINNLASIHSQLSKEMHLIYSGIVLYNVPHASEPTWPQGLGSSEYQYLFGIRSCKTLNKPPTAYENVMEKGIINGIFRVRRSILGTMYG